MIPIRSNTAIAPAAHAIPLRSQPAASIAQSRRDIALRLHKPSWTRNLELTPEHFQRQDQYHEQLVEFAVRSTCDHAWGVLELALDATALESGSIVIERLKALLPDGSPVVVGPSGNARISPRSFEGQLGTPGSTVDVCVALPCEHPLEPNVAGPHAAGLRPRYVPITSSVRDFNSGRDPVDVDWLCADLCLLSDDEVLEQHVALPVARLRRATTGAIELDPSFAPASLRLHSSPVLERTVASVRSDLLTAAATLQSLPTNDGDIASLPDAARMLVMLVLRRALSDIESVLSRRWVKPREAFDAMARALGALSAFAPSGFALVPTYAHANLGPCFIALAADIHRALSWIGTPPYRALRVVRSEDGVWHATSNEPGLFSREFVLVATGSDPNQLRSHLPQIMRIAPSDELGDLTRNAVNGVRLIPETRRLVGLPLAPTSACFRFDKTSATWGSVVSKASLAFALPPQFANIELAVFVENERALP